MEHRFASTDLKTLPQLPSGPKFSGGGFNMSAGPRSHVSASHLSADLTSNIDDVHSVSGISGKEIQQQPSPVPQNQDRPSTSSGNNPQVQVPTAVSEIPIEALEQQEISTT
jgi:hypothetical protein